MCRTVRKIQNFKLGVCGLVILWENILITILALFILSIPLLLIAGLIVWLIAGGKRRKSSE